MTFETRLSLLIFNGVQDWPGMRPLYLFTDVVTGSTFSIEPGQTVGQGLAQFLTRWKALGGDDGLAPADQTASATSDGEVAA